MTKVALLTSGGDSPGMNAFLYSFAAAAKLNNVDIIFVVNGYEGLIDSIFKSISLCEIKKHLFSAGTIIGSSRCLKFKDSAEARKQSVENLKKIGATALIVLGGNGSYLGAELISELNFPIIAVPGTIDNDIASSGYTIGFLSCMNEICHSIRKLSFTSNSHSQVTFLEVMGRNCSDLSAYSGLASAVDYIITRDNPKSTDELFQLIQEMKQVGKKGVVVLISEKVYGKSGDFNLPELSEVAVNLEKKLNCQVRVNILGHLQRGSFPTSYEIFMADLFGKYTFELLKKKIWNVAVGYNGKNFYNTDIKEANKMKNIAAIDLIEYHNSFYKTV